MSRKTEYEIVAAGNNGELTDLVNVKLAEGWRLRGSIVVHGGKVLQALTRRTKPAKRIRKTSED